MLLGLGSSSALFGWQLDRPLAWAFGAVLLCAGLLLSLRRSRVCAVRPAARWRQIALLLATFALAYGVLGMLAPALAVQQEEAAVASAAPVAPVVAPASSVRRATLIVEKMECPPCAAHVRSLLGRKPFVRSFVAEAFNQQVVIDYDSRQIDAKRLAKLFPLRYRVTLLDDAPLS